MRLRVTAFCSALFLVAAQVAASSELPVWRWDNREDVRGELAAVFGSMALVIDGPRDFFIPLDHLDDVCTKRVADFLAAKPSPKPIWKTSNARLTKALRGVLEIQRDGQLKPFDPGLGPEPDIYLIYFSAHWCPPCQRFTPELVKDYHLLQENVPGRVEVIYVSNDQSAEEQQQYVREANMPWPVLRYSELGQVREVERWAGKGIPCLVALTPEGKLICHSYNGDEYLGPEQVVTAINNLVPMINNLVPMIKGTAPEILRARHRLAVMQYINVAGKNNRPPKPYFTQLNSSHYQTLEVEPKLPVVIEDELGQDLADNWLFLPAIENGKAVGKTVKIPLQFKHSLVER